MKFCKEYIKVLSSLFIIFFHISINYYSVYYTIRLFSIVYACFNYYLFIIKYIIAVNTREIDKYVKADLKLICVVEL